MKSIPLDLTADVVSVYDQTKTTVLGRAAKKTLTPAQGGKTVVGTPLNVWVDTLTDALPTAFTGVRGTVSQNNHQLLFNTSTAAGVVIASLYDIDETTGARTYVGKIQFQLPATTHTQRFGRLVNDSGATGWRILFGSIGAVAASGGLFSIENIAKADFVQGIPTSIPVATAAGQKAVYWHQETGGTNNLTVLQGAGHEADAGLGTQKIYVANGLVATPNFYVFDSSLTITTVLAGGITTDWYVLKTGTVTGMAGTNLLLDNYSVCIPTAASGAPVSHQGATCLFVPASTNAALIKVTDFTSGATTLPTYTSRDVLDAPNSNTAITPATMHFSNTLQRIIFQAAGTFVIKQFVNGSYELVFGASGNTQYRQLQNLPFYEFGSATVVATHIHNGWIHEMSSTAGQNGIISFDLRSLFEYGYSAMISKVIDVPDSTFVFLSIATPLRSFGKYQYRLSGFGTATGGWADVPEDRDMTGIPNTTGQIQIQFMPRMERDSVTVPLQIIEAYLITQPLAETSDYWVGSVDNSSLSGASPFYIDFRLQRAYPSVVPKMYLYGTDDSGNSVIFDTVTHASQFSYTTNNGSSYSPLGTIPNVALTTELRFQWTTPDGVRRRWALRES